MAGFCTKGQVPVGSIQWIKDERDQIAVFCDQESEDFAFSARNEVEWLNEHMAEIFNSSQLNVAEIFKTPGKLRGKTPRTARKINHLETRAPLTDIFTTNVLSNSPTRNTPFNAKLGNIQLHQQNATEKAGTVKFIDRRAKQNIDSGYHGMPEDDMEVDENPGLPIPITTRQGATTEADAMQIDSNTGYLEVKRVSDERRTTEGSFHSATENLTSRYVPRGSIQHSEVGKAAEVEEVVEAVKTRGQVSDKHLPLELGKLPSRSPQKHEDITLDEGKESLLEEDHELGTSRSPSEGSSPAKPLMRKSSLTFASLPAREPLATKMSIGARTSRTSHLDQGKSTALNCNSYFGRYTGGKSLGGTRQPEHVNEVESADAMEVDEAERSGLPQGESDGEGKIAMLHNKSSTQRLHERINLLGQTQPTRSHKSVAASTVLSAQPAYPELPRAGEDQTQIKCQQKESGIASPMVIALDDDDDWIKPPSQQPDKSTRPQLSKSRSVDVMEEIRGKESIGGNTFTTQPINKAFSKEPSPLRSHVHDSRPGTGSDHISSISTTVFPSPKKPAPNYEVVPKKPIAVSNSELASVPSATPAGSPASKSHHDGPLNASKSKLQSILKSARGLFTSSAGVSAQAKMETLSPSSMKLRSQGQDVTDDLVAKTTVGPSSLSHMLYPSLPHGPQVLLQNTTSSKSEGRTTRSSTEKEEKQKGKDAKDRQRAEEDLNRARDQGRHKASKLKALEKLAATSNASAESSVIETIPLKASKLTRQSPRRQQIQDEVQILDAGSEGTAKQVEDADLAQSMGPPSRPLTQPSQIQKPKDMRRPIKPAKEAVPKPKPQPVAIRVGTLSQRIPLTNAALSSTLQESLPVSNAKQSSVVKKTSNTSLQTSASVASFKSSVSSLSSKPKALLAAERKREQDDKEAQRKLEHKREIERKRAAQQEEAQKRDQLQRQELERQKERERALAVEDSKKITQKQVIEKRRLELSKKTEQKDIQRTANDLAAAIQQEKVAPSATSSRSELGGGRPPSRLNNVQEYPRAPNTYPLPNPAKPPAKRLFEADFEDEPIRAVRTQGGQSSQQNDAKRRRTEDEETHDAPIRPTMAPPIRQSNIRKDGPKASIFSSNYTTALQPANSHAASIKPSSMNQSYQQHPYHSQATRSAQPMDMAKYTNGKIPFAEAPNPPPPSYKTPFPSKQGIAGATKSSPLFTNGDNIHLEDIPSDTDDEDSETENEKKKNLPDWVLTPNLDERLREQERLNPDVLFGPIAPLVMEDIFKDKNRHHRFRSRTSSANWFGQDKLTEEEVRADNAARERLRREGGWTFGL